MIRTVGARTAVVEREEHFAEEAATTQLVGTVRETQAVGGESYEAETMYPHFAAQAQAAGDREAADRFREIGQDESRHRDLFLSPSSGPSLAPDPS